MKIREVNENKKQFISLLLLGEILEKILIREDVSKVPLVYQSAMIHAIKEVLEEENVSDAKSEYDI